MAVNKVEFNGRVLIDLTSDTVVAETLAEGVTAHGADGEPIVGTMNGPEDLDTVLTEQEELIATLQDILMQNTESSDAGSYNIADGTITNTERIQVNNAKLRECIELAKHLTITSKLGTAKLGIMKLA